MLIYIFMNGPSHFPSLHQTRCSFGQKGHTMKESAIFIFIFFGKLWIGNQSKVQFPISAPIFLNCILVLCF